MDDAGEVVDRRRLAEVGVHDQFQLLKLLEDAVDRRGTDFGAFTLDCGGDLVSREVPAGRDQDFGDRSLSRGDALRGATHRRHHGLDVWRGAHPARLGPRVSRHSCGRRDVNASNGALVAPESRQNLFGLDDHVAHDLAGRTQRVDGAHDLTRGVALAIDVHARRVLVAPQVKDAVV